MPKPKPSMFRVRRGKRLLGRIYSNGCPAKNKDCLHHAELVQGKLEENHFATFNEARAAIQQHVRPKRKHRYRLVWNNGKDFYEVVTSTPELAYQSACRLYHDLPKATDARMFVTQVKRVQVELPWRPSEPVTRKSRW